MEHVRECSHRSRYRDPLKRPLTHQRVHQRVHLSESAKCEQYSTVQYHLLLKYVNIATKITPSRFIYPHTQPSSLKETCSNRIDIEKIFSKRKEKHFFDSLRKVDQILTNFFYYSISLYSIFFSKKMG